MSSGIVLSFIMPQAALLGRPGHALPEHLTLSKLFLSWNCSKTYMSEHTCWIAVSLATSIQTTPCVTELVSKSLSDQDKEAESVSGWELLKAFTRKDFKNEAQEFINTPAKRDQIRSAVMVGLALRYLSCM